MEFKNNFKFSIEFCGCRLANKFTLTYDPSQKALYLKAGSQESKIKDDVYLSDFCRTCEEFALCHTESDILQVIEKI